MPLAEEARETFTITTPLGLFPTRVPQGVLNFDPAVHPAARHNIDIVTGSRMNYRVTTVEGLPSSTGLNSS